MAIVGLVVILVSRVRTGPDPSPAQGIPSVVTPAQDSFVMQVQQSPDNLRERLEEKHQVSQTLVGHAATIDGLYRQRIDVLKQRFDGQADALDVLKKQQVQALDRQMQGELEDMEAEYLVHRRYLESTRMEFEKRNEAIRNLNLENEIKMRRLQAKYRPSYGELEQREIAARFKLDNQRREVLIQLQRQFDLAKAQLQAVIDDYDQDRMGSQEALQAQLRILQEIDSP